jgi:histidinol-phosphate aminotransferase
MLSAPAMDRLLAALPAEVLVVADEAYSHYVARSDYPDSIRYVLKGCPLIVLHSFSKVYGLAGLRLGYGIARPDLIAQLWRYRRNFHLGRLELAAGIAALGDLEHVARSVKLAQEGRTYFYAALARLGVKFWPSEANFVLFQPARAAAEVCEELLERGIMVRPTEGNGLPGCLRVSTGLPEANAAFIQALSAVLHPS